MHKVIPGMRQFGEDGEMDLGDITVVTLRNQGTHDIRYGFGDGFSILREGQERTYEAGANTVYSNKVRLKFEFLELATAPGASDFKQLHIEFNRLSATSRMFAGVLGE